jgi:hypothetical protein
MAYVERCRDVAALLHCRIADMWLHCCTTETWLHCQNVATLLHYRNVADCQDVVALPRPIYLTFMLSDPSHDIIPSSSDIF